VPEGIGIFVQQDPIAVNILRLLTYFRLGDNAEDPAVALESIARNVVFRGTNLLILVFAILIASVGLNVNSAPVIIGAMLISPLMGPIVGVGAGLGVLDLNLVRRALKNLAFAVAASVVTSTLYFLVSPLDDAYSEILARTNPTIWDVLIAAAGGFAGIIASASKDRGNVVPGVAIATALMPPLCTVGYGLAHANWAFCAGALFLFLINSVFISLAAFVTVRWLKYPTREFADAVTRRRIVQVVSGIVLLTVAPSIWLAVRLVQQNTFKQRADRFVSTETDIPDNYLVQRTVDPLRRSIVLTYMGTGVDSVQENVLRRRLEVHNLKDCDLQVRTGLSLKELGREERTRSAGLQRQLEEQRALLAQLSAIKDSLAQREAFRDQLMGEALALEPELRWLVVVDIPGQADSFPRVVSARFVHYPDSTQVRRLDRWLGRKLNGRGHTLVIAADSLPKPQEPQVRQRMR
jgi:uncharacterized hydrophobic protein (TIGR00271 family)